MALETKDTFNEPDDARLVEDADLYKEFISESCEHLQDIEADILSLEETPDDLDTINNIFRCVHSIKGSAGFLCIEKIQGLSHETETLLDKARKNELKIDATIINVLLNSIDVLSKLFDRLSLRTSRVTGINCERPGKTDSEDEIDISEPLSDIQSILAPNNDNEVNVKENKEGKKKEKETVKEKSKTKDSVNSNKKDNVVKDDIQLQENNSEQNNNETLVKTVTRTDETYSEPDDARLIEDADLYKEFISESCEHLQSIETDILSLEDAPSDLDTINNIFRCVHSIKGSAGFLHIEKIQKLSHETETLLDKARKNELKVNTAIINVLLNAIDVLFKLFDCLSLRTSRVTGTNCERPGKTDSEEDIDISELLRNIQSILESNVEQHQKIGEILVESGIVTKNQLDSAVLTKEKKIGEILVESGTATKKDVEKAIEKQNSLTGKEDEQHQKIGEILVESGIVTKNQLDNAVLTKEKKSVKY